MSTKFDVLVEVTRKRSFASAAEWPGWSRGAKTADEALDALLAYGPRYAKVARRAKVAFSPPTDMHDFKVIERLTGGASTEFGIPGEEGKADDRRMDARELKRQLALLRAAWNALEAAARRAKGVTLTAGPRGGGRNLAKIVAHVAEAEEAYVTKLGSRPPKDATDPTATRRALIVDALTARAGNREPPNPSKTRKRWPPRYFLRRAAWHVLDHCWEIEDRSAGGRKS